MASSYVSFLNRIQYLSIFLIFTVGVPINAQDSLGNFIFKYLGQSQNLVDFQASFFHQDADGYLWISSTDGYNRFDGHRVKLYKPNNKLFSHNPIITSNIFGDSAGDFWFSTQSGIHRIDNKTDTISSYRIYSPSEKKYLALPKLFYINKSNEIWIYADPNWYVLSRTNPGKATFKAMLDSKFQRVKVIQDTLGQPKMIAGSYFGKGFYLKYLQQKKDRTSRRLSPHMIANLTNEADSILWIASMSGLIKYDLVKDTIKNLYPPPAGKKGFFDVNLFGKNKLWIGAIDARFYLFDKEKSFTPLEKYIKIDQKYLPILGLDKSFIDRMNNLWLVDWTSGIYYTNLNKYFFQHLIPNKVNLIQGQYDVKNLVVDHENKVWALIGQANTIYCFQGERPIVKNITMPNASHLVTDAMGAVWGVKGKTIQALESKGSISCDGAIQRIAKLPNGLALAYTEAGFFLIDFKNRVASKLGFARSKNSVFTLGSINTIFTDNQGHCFINHETKDLYIFKIKGQNLVLESNLTNVGRINGLIADIANNGYWLSSSLGLMHLIRTKEAWNFDNNYRKNEVLSTALNGVLQDREGHLWLCSNEQLLRFDPQKPGKKISRFTVSDGIMSGQFNMEVSLRDLSGKLYFGGTNGITMIDPGRLNTDTIQPRLLLDGISINGRESFSHLNVNRLTSWKFKPNQRNLSFRFITIDYLSPDENEFQYRLTKRSFLKKGNNESPWVSLGTTPLLSLANLSKGHYTLEVIAANSDGLWMKKEHALRFSFYIQPKWHETNLFYFLMLASIVFLSYGIHRSRIKRLKEQAETELKVLRLQMNPHFIYNSLSAIQSYIIQQNIDKADRLISNFAKLMRKILTDSVKANLSLQEEKDLLESYLLTESLRFENKINFEISIAEDLDPDGVFIPTMIVQPFVENAIVHGLKRKNGQGTIKVNFSQSNGMLEVVVEDDGDGFIKKESANAHQSKAIEITQRRLALLPNSGKESASLKSFNLADKDPSRSGFRIEIRLPLAYKAI